jgi:alcohol dehydrogenase class IV
MDAINPFSYFSQSPKVIFGSGTIAQLPEELKFLKASNPLIISSLSRVSLAHTIRDLLSAAGINAVEILDTAQVHNPSEIIESGLAKAEARDVLISVGGGSAVGLGKAIGFRTGIPHVCVPTTYSGSEMTPILGETKDGKKTSTTDARILPAIVFYDVDLTMDLPPKISGPSGVNAIAHSSMPRIHCNLRFNVGDADRYHS